MKRLIALSAVVLSLLPARAADAPPPVIYNLTVSNTTKSFQFTPAPAISNYTVLSGTDLSQPLVPAAGTACTRWPAATGAK